MNTLAHHTAILFFSRSASEEGQIKSFSKKNGSNAKISRRLIQHTRDEIKKTDLPFFHYGSKEQSGTSFGERFSNALHSVFNKGFDNVIAVGNDCPLLNSKDIIDACRLLEKGSNVIGPAEDGGIYLLGIKKTDFEKKCFQNLKWQLSGLLSDIHHYFECREGQISLLRIKQDIDKERDLLSFFRKNGPLEIVASLKEIYYETSSIFQVYLAERKSNNIFLQTFGMRGPPRSGF